MIFDDYEAASELEGKPQQVGERTVVRSGIVPYWGTQTCQQYLFLTPDQPMIVIYALTYDDEAIDSCAIAEAATTAAIDALTRDACSLLDDMTLATVRDLDPLPPLRRLGLSLGHEW